MVDIFRTGVWKRRSTIVRRPADDHVYFSIVTSDSKAKFTRTFFQNFERHLAPFITFFKTFSPVIAVAVKTPEKRAAATPQVTMSWPVR